MTFFILFYFVLSIFLFVFILNMNFVYLLFMYKRIFLEGNCIDLCFVLILSIKLS